MLRRVWMRWDGGIMESGVSRELGVGSWGVGVWVREGGAREG